MKNNSIIFFLCLFSISIYAQDVIYKIDGNEIKAKIVEIEAASIKYKNFEQLEGPIRNIPISQVFMIKYQDGTVEKYTNITNLKTAPAIDSTEKPRIAIAKDIDIQIERAMSMKNTGNALAGFGVFCLSTGGVLLVLSSGKHSETTEQKIKNMKTAGYILLGIGVPFFIPGVIVSGIGQSQLHTLKKRKSELSFQMVPFDNFNNGKIISAQALSVGIRISF